MENRLGYPVEITKDDNGTWLVTSRDLPELVTYGETQEEALSHAVEALELVLSIYIDKGMLVPKPSPARQRPIVQPSLSARMKLILYIELKEAKMRKLMLAKKMGIKPQQINRLFDLKHKSRIDQIESAFHALNLLPTLDVEKNLRA